MSKSPSYPALVEYKDMEGSDGLSHRIFRVMLPDFPDVAACGDAEDDFRDLGRQLIYAAMADHIRSGTSIPAPGDHPSANRFISIDDDIKVGSFRRMVEHVQSAIEKYLEEVVSCVMAAQTPLDLIGSIDQAAPNRPEFMSERTNSLLRRLVQVVAEKLSPHQKGNDNNITNNFFVMPPLSQGQDNQILTWNRADKGMDINTLPPILTGRLAAITS